MTESTDEDRNDRLNRQAFDLVRESIDKCISLTVVEKKIQDGFGDPNEIKINYDNMNITGFDNQSNLDRWKFSFGKKVKECESKLIPIVDRYNRLEAAIEVLNEGWNDCLIQGQIEKLRQILSRD